MTRGALNISPFKSGVTTNGHHTCATQAFQPIIPCASHLDRQRRSVIFAKVYRQPGEGQLGSTMPAATPISPGILSSTTTSFTCLIANSMHMRRSQSNEISIALSQTTSDSSPTPIALSPQARKQASFLPSAASSAPSLYTAQR